MLGFGAVIVRGKSSRQPVVGVIRPEALAARSLNDAVFLCCVEQRDCTDMVAV
jgi:hypothetical protein